MHRLFSIPSSRPSPSPSPTTSSSSCHHPTPKSMFFSADPQDLVNEFAHALSSLSTGSNPWLLFHVSVHVQLRSFGHLYPTPSLLPCCSVVRLLRLDRIVSPSLLPHSLPYLTMIMSRLTVLLLLVSTLAIRGQTGFWLDNLRPLRAPVFQTFACGFSPPNGSYAAGYCSKNVPSNWRSFRCTSTTVAMLPHRQRVAVNSARDHKRSWMGRVQVPLQRWTTKTQT